MSRSNELIEFIKKNKFDVNPYKITVIADQPESTRDIIKPNFLSLVGGSWYIPKSEMFEFYNIIRRMIVANIPLSIVEVRTEIFKYFIDLDIMSPQAILAQTLHKIALIIHKCIQNECLNLMGTSVNPTQYGYMAPPREIPQKGCIKTGVHIYYPELHVNNEQALELRKRLIICFKLIPELNSINWEDVIDQSVYKSSGLRLPHIPKLKRCQCKRVNSGDCLHGCSYGVINENAIYSPEWIIYGKSSKDPIVDTSAVDKIKNNLRYSLELTQIRTDDNHVNIAIKDRNTTQTDTTTLYNALDNPQPNRKIHSNNNVSRKINNFYTDSESRLDLDKQLKIETFIRQNFKNYNTINVQIVKQVTFKALNRHDIYTKYFIGTTTRYCQNISREHKSNNIYFIIFTSGRSMKITQRCHCTCATPHVGTTELCSSYSSQPIDIKVGSELYKMLMPRPQNAASNSDDFQTVVTNTLNIDVTNVKGNKAMLMAHLRKINPNIH